MEVNEYEEAREGEEWKAAGDEWPGEREMDEGNGEEVSDWGWYKRKGRSGDASKGKNKEVIHNSWWNEGEIERRYAGYECLWESRVKEIGDKYLALTGGKEE